MILDIIMHIVILLDNGVFFGLDWVFKKDYGLYMYLIYSIDVTND